MRRLRNVKIVATLGPSSDDYDTIRALFIAGADVFRLNFSHGSPDSHGRVLALVREDHPIPPLSAFGVPEALSDLVGTLLAADPENPQWPLKQPYSTPVDPDRS